LFYKNKTPFLGIIPHFLEKYNIITVFFNCARNEFRWNNLKKGIAENFRNPF